MRRALASAYPAELGLCCEALGLPYRKDPEARKAMLRPQLLSSRLALVIRRWPFAQI